jgi:hypothetical protein
VTIRVTIRAETLDGITSIVSEITAGEEGKPFPCSGLPQQDSNLRSRLRRERKFKSLTKTKAGKQAILERCGRAAPSVRAPSRRNPPGQASDDPPTVRARGQGRMSYAG